jgi:hypothetical protein
LSSTNPTWVYCGQSSTEIGLYLRASDFPEYGDARKIFWDTSAYTTKNIAGFKCKVKSSLSPYYPWIIATCLKIMASRPRRQ